MASDPSQNIRTFLENLKLADKYCDLFTSHGYMTVGDCVGISEDNLKHIGVTLPGKNMSGNCYYIYRTQTKR